MTRFGDRRIESSDFEAARHAMTPMSWRTESRCDPEPERDDESEREIDVPETATNEERNDVAERQRALLHPWDVGPA